MINTSNIPLQFGIQLKNTYTTTDVTVALFNGTIPSIGLALNSESEQVLTKGDKTQMLLAGFPVDAVMCDGVLPINGIIPAKNVARIEAASLDTPFTIEHLKEWLKSNTVIIKKMTIKATTQDQFDNQLTFATVSPLKSYGKSVVAPTNYSLPSYLQSNKIVIDDIPVRLQDDTLCIWKINAGETVNITLELAEPEV